MPVYNASKFLQESITSILNQTFTDFELLCIDDGSTDNSKEIIESFNDPRIIYKPLEHSGIVNALNYGITLASTDLIARMDADDYMIEDRLQYQFDYMNEHKDCDILGGGFIWWDGRTDNFEELHRFGLNGDIDIKMLLGGNRLGHGCVMMRKSSLMKLPYIYEQYYQDAEDYKLWFTALSHGLKIQSTAKIANLYRTHDGQITGHSDRQTFLTGVIQRAYQFTLTGKKYDPEARLTVIIPYQNEEEEVEKTICNIRGTTEHVNIILVNDCSDPYDYETPANMFKCFYYNETTNRGVAGSRDYGVSLCKTPNFVLLDAHMRFNDINWERTLNGMVDSHPTSVITTNTYVISRDEDLGFKRYKNAHGQDSHATSVCAKIDIKDGWEMNAEWVYEQLNGTDKSANAIPVSCVLGAVYATKKAHWQNMIGLRGLVKYGLDETMISMKTWMMGGMCIMLKNFYVGHYYRAKNPYPISRLPIDRNQLYCARLFAPDDIYATYKQHLLERLGTDAFNEVLKNFDEQECLEHRELLQPKLKYDFQWFMKNINANVPSKKES